MIEALRARALVAAGDPQAAESVQRSMLAAHPDRLDSRLRARRVAVEPGAAFRSCGAPRRSPGVPAALAGAAPTAGGGALPRRRSRSAGDAWRATCIAEFPDNSAVRVLLATIEQADGRWASVLELDRRGRRTGSAARSAQLSRRCARSSAWAGSKRRWRRSPVAAGALAAPGALPRGAAGPGERRPAGGAQRSRRGRGGASAAQVLAAQPPLDRRDRRCRCACSWPTSSSNARVWPRRWRRSATSAAHPMSPSATSWPCGPAMSRRPPRGGRSWRGGTVEEVAGARRRRRTPRADSRQALPLLEKALAADPASSELRFRKATALERSGRFEESAAIFERPDRQRTRSRSGAQLPGLHADRARCRGRTGPGARAAGAADRSQQRRLRRFAGLGPLPARDASPRRARCWNGPSACCPTTRPCSSISGDAWLALGARDRARDAYRRALALGTRRHRRPGGEAGGAFWGFVACGSRSRLTLSLLGLGALGLPMLSCAAAAPTPAAIRARR